MNVLLSTSQISTSVEESDIEQEDENLDHSLSKLTTVYMCIVYYSILIYLDLPIHTSNSSALHHNELLCINVSSLVVNNHNSYKSWHHFP